MPTHELTRCQDPEKSHLHSCVNYSRLQMEACGNETEVVEPSVASKVRKKRTSNGTGYVRLRVTLKVEQGKSQVGDFDVCTAVCVCVCCYVCVCVCVVMCVCVCVCVVMC